FGLARHRTWIDERFYERPTSFVRHLARRRRQSCHEAEFVKRRRPNCSQDLARLANGAAQQLGRLADLDVLNARALELRVGGDEDRRQSVVQIARKAAPIFFFLGEKLPGEML